MSAMKEYVIVTDAEAEMYRNRVQNTMNMLEAMNEHKVRMVQHLLLACSEIRDGMADWPELQSLFDSYLRLNLPIFAANLETLNKHFTDYLDERLRS